MNKFRKVFCLSLLSCNKFGFIGFSLKNPNSTVFYTIFGLFVLGGSNMYMTMCIRVCTDCRWITPVIVELLQNTERKPSN